MTQNVGTFLNTLAIVGLLVFSTNTATAVPMTVPYIGQLQYDTGVNYFGEVELKATLHADMTQNTPIWGPYTFAEVDVTDGVFTILLGGDGSPALESGLLLEEGVWLEFTINGTTMSPRQFVASVPYALLADDAAHLGGLEPSAFATWDQITAQQYVKKSDLGEVTGVTLSQLAELGYLTLTQLIEAGFATVDELVAVLQGTLHPVAFSGKYTDLIGAPAPVVSVDGLAGGTIAGAVEITGAVVADAVAAGAITQNGQPVCDKSGNCGPTLESLNCAINQVPRMGADGWECAAYGGGGSGVVPETDCAGPYKALQFQGGKFICVDLPQTGTSKGSAKGFEIVDSWGYAWDGVERHAATWTLAAQHCASLGGRLPTITELYRVSIAHKADVGTTYDTNYLWSRTQWAPGQHGRVKLTDGAVTGTNDTTAGPYRCVWPNNTANWFTGNHCYGEPESECYLTGPASKRYNIDKLDRPAVPYVAALDECNFYNASVPTQLDFAEAITDGLPNGSNQYLHTSDATRYDINNIVRWTNVQLDYTDTGSFVTWTGRSSAYRFRCIGVNYNAPKSEVTIPNPYVAPSLRIVSTMNDAPATSLAQAASLCYASGGHVAMERDYAELVRSGMPNGSNTWLWTGDYSRYDIAQVIRWTGIDKDYTDYYSTYATWQTIKGSSSPYRCVYYPVDASYQGPPSCTTNFPCVVTALGNGPVQSKTWFDPVDRPPVNYITAVKTCKSVGGRLPTARDYLEHIRNGLSNGSTNWVWTSDQVGDGGQNVEVIKWNAAEPAFDGTYSTYATNSDKGATTNRPYRCIWSNELR